MKRSQAEDQAIRTYREKYLPKELSESSVRTYIGALTSTGELTIAAKKAGILSRETESLLTLQDREMVVKIALWWQEEGEKRYPQKKTAMHKWLGSWKIGKPEDPHVPYRYSKLEQPPYGVRLRFVVEKFSEALRDEHTKRQFEMETVLQILSGNQDFIIEAQDYQEHTAAFRSLRKNILHQLDSVPDYLVDQLCRQYTNRQLERACHYVVYSCLNQWGGMILNDLRCRAVEYSNSIWERLERIEDVLHKDTETDRTRMALEGFLEILRFVLVDCDPFSRDQAYGSEPGQALKDSRFWESALLWNWLAAAPVSTESLSALLQLTAPENTCKDRLQLCLFQGMLAHMAPIKGKKISQYERESAEDWAGRALKYLKLHWETLKPVLTKRQADWHQSVPEAHLLGGQAHCLLWAQLLVRQAELAVESGPDSESTTRWGYRIMKAQESLRQAENIFWERIQDKLHIEEVLAGRYDLHKLWVRLHLCRARTYLQLAWQEQEENCLSDAVKQYMDPARKALRLAQLRLEDVPKTQSGQLNAQWKKLRTECMETFFNANSQVLSRMGLREEKDTEVYHKEFEAWKRDVNRKDSALQVPNVVRRLNESCLRSAEQFDAIYCGIFDSVLGKDPDNRQAVELTLFQMLASGKVCLLQLNQIVDNRVMLNLMPTPGFRQACREGIVTLSCFGQIDSPRDYLCSSLRNPGFIFSSSALYDLPEGAEKDAIEGSFRLAMLDYLEKNDRTAFRLAAKPVRDEAEFLMESYAILFECFQPADLLRFHQNPKTRFPRCAAGVQLPAIQTLDQVIEQRVQQLLREAQSGDLTKNTDTLQALMEYAKKWNGLNNRSQYDTEIKKALQNAETVVERGLLEKFRKLVDQCYFISNGRRSCETVLLTESDPDLIQTGESGQECIPGQDTLTRILRQKQRPADDSNLTWTDLCEIALIVREIDQKEKNRSAQERAQIKAAETGLGYDVSGENAIASELIPKTSIGNVVKITREDSGDTEVLEIHKLKPI